MCDGMEFCGQCRNETVEAWAAGRSHILPEFGDGSQRYTASYQREQLIEQLREDGDLNALAEFPEWTYAEGESHEVPRFASIYQRERVINRRRNLIKKLLRIEDTVALRQFPEWGVTLKLMEVRASATLSGVLTEMRPTINKPASPASSRRKTKYRRYISKWNRPFGGAYQHLLDKLCEQVGRASVKVAETAEPEFTVVAA